MKQKSYKFSGLASSSYEAAKKIVPVLFDIIGIPESILDLGGGEGAWCRAFKEHGVKKILCIDHPSVQSVNLMIDETEFLRYDLDKKIPEPQKCDLAISIEFAEHLKKSRSESVVKFLTQSASVVLFSAAIPRQGGTGHINEQRPKFWRELFKAEGFEVIDVIRPRIIFDSSVPCFLRQNLYLYVKQDALNLLSSELELNSFIPNDFEIVETRILEKPLGLTEILKEFPNCTLRALRNRLLKS
jgi:hypothetical protein